MQKLILFLEMSFYLVFIYLNFAHLVYFRVLQK